jgi:hypothetical protein
MGESCKLAVALSMPSLLAERTTACTWPRDLFRGGSV